MPSRLPKDARNLFSKLRDDGFQLFVPAFVAEVGQAQCDPVRPVVCFQQLQSAVVRIAVCCQELFLLAWRKVADLENAVDMPGRNRGRVGRAGDTGYKSYGPSNSVPQPPPPFP